jgi:hypothetical protein
MKHQPFPLAELLREANPKGRHKWFSLDNIRHSLHSIHLFYNILLVPVTALLCGARPHLWIVPTQNAIHKSVLVKHGSYISRLLLPTLSLTHILLRLFWIRRPWDKDIPEQTFLYLSFNMFLLTGFMVSTLTSNLWKFYTITEIRFLWNLWKPHVLSHNTDRHFYIYHLTCFYWLDSWFRHPPPIYGTFIQY